jgi:hypothetical protein
LVIAISAEEATVGNINLHLVYQPVFDYVVPFQEPFDIIPAGAKGQPWNPTDCFVGRAN